VTSEGIFCAKLGPFGAIWANFELFASQKMSIFFIRKDNFEYRGKYKINDA
jgi:hypothetical protein